MHSFRQLLLACVVFMLTMTVAIGQSLPAPAEAPKAPEPDPCAFDWAQVPPVRPLPRPGYFIIPPSGAGYYSLRDQLSGQCREQAPPLPFGLYGFYQPSFFDADFRYLDKKGAAWDDIWDPLKRVQPGDDWLVSFGGQTWYRQMNEVDRQLSTRDNNYGLYRARLYSDVWYRDEVRFFVEGIYAGSAWQDVDPMSTDRNQGDFQNLFLEVKAFEFGDRPVYVRVGRQELLFGSQRLISTLDWANTRRTFQGARAYRTSEKFDVDLFWANPVLPQAFQLDSVDNNVNFAGVWTTYKPRKGTTLDLYYLFIDNTSPVAEGAFGDRSGYHAHTLGSRYAGDREGVLWDFEAMLQLGEWANQDLVAGATTAGLGYHWRCAAWNPQAWVYYDWASGDASPGQGGTRSTFQQLFPFGHYYFGYLDLVGRKNIHDVSAQFVCYPENWITALAQVHRFWLADASDALYNAAGQVIREDRSGRAGQDVGTEIDLVLSLHVTAHADLLLGWSKLFRGSFIDRSGPAVSPELLYAQFGYRW